MIKLLIDWGSASAWTLGGAVTALDIMGIEDIQGIPTNFGWLGYALSFTFVLAGVAKTVNLVLNGIQEREGKKLDNRLKEQELYYDMLEEIKGEKTKNK